jgi:beta-phosphoglucomutase
MNDNLWAVLFDVDGTMVDNLGFHEQAWIEFGRIHNIEITSEMYRKHIHSRPNDDNIRFVCGDQVDPGAIQGLSDEKEQIYRARYRPVLRSIDGLVPLLEALSHVGVPCAAVSNSPPENVDMVLEELKIRPHLRTVLNISHVARGKPDPEILYRAAREIGVAPARCIVMEDSISGFLAAEAAGMPLVVITAGADPEELPRAVSARAVHRDFTTLSVDKLREYAMEAEPPATRRKM